MYFNHKAKNWVSPETVDPEVRSFHQRLPEFAETPLRPLPEDCSHSLGVRQICVKDESTRCGLPAFKILGASWGAYRAIADHLKCSKSEPLDHIQQQAQVANIRLYTATDGNHGRAVARFASVLGLKALVYVPQTMHETTKQLISQEGASVIVVSGDYDDAVKTAERRSDECNGILVQDTAWPGYEKIPRWIVDGYSTMMVEIDQQMHDLFNKGPDLIVVPVGVGSLAHAVVAHYKQKEQNCTILAVEPENAACLKTSLEEGQITTVTTADTSMCGMNCGTVSFTAWPRLCRGIDACITVTDDETEDAQAILGKQEINVGPCAAATMAALQKACKHHKDQLHLNEDSVVVLLATEGPR